MKKGGFILTKFKSNSVEVLKTLPSDKYEFSEQKLEIDGDQVERTLGINWKMQDDYFNFTTNMKKYNATKRGILSAFNSAFDLLGFLTPFTMKAKLLIYEMWKEKIEGDDELPREILKVWLLQV